MVGSRVPRDRQATPKGEAAGRPFPRSEDAPSSLKSESQHLKALSASHALSTDVGTVPAKLIEHCIKALNQRTSCQGKGHSETSAHIHYQQVPWS